MKTRSILKILTINIVLVLFLMEIISIIYVKIFKPDLGELNTITTYLSFRLDDVYMDAYDPMGPHFVDTALAWTTWHVKNGRFRHRKPCFDVVMRFNEEGTRGMLPDPSDTHTVIFVGDSFTEGYGLPEDKTIPANFARITGLPVLNLGTSGYFGTTQYGLIYEEFSQRYRHQQVFVLLFLANDLSENNIRLYPKLFSSSKRYRPYRDGSDLRKIVYLGSPDSSLNSMQSYLRSDQKNKRKVIQLGFRSYFKNNTSQRLVSKFYHLSYISRSIHILKRAMENNIPSELTYTPYDLSIIDQDISSMCTAANKQGARITFINIPDKALMEKIKEHPEYDRQYLELEQHISEQLTGSDHRFRSFYQHLKSAGVDHKSLLVDCDGHFNEKGSALLAAFIASK